MITPHGILGYCSNIHPGEKWEEHFAELKKYVPKVKARVCPDKPFGLGLRIANQASIDLLANPNLLEELKNWLATENIFVYTLNGFPYGGFHQTRVKDDVHKPDWTTKERLEYTKRLADILVQLLPDFIESAGISTSPLSYKFWWNESTVDAAMEQATAHIIELADYLNQIKEKTGKHLHLDIEPEPDGFLGDHAEFVAWYTKKLLPASFNQERIKEHIQICFDVCHYGVSFDAIATSLDELKEKGIRIGKIQISSALKVDLSEDFESKINTLSQYREPVYLHQVRAKKADGEAVAFGDLDEALDTIDTSYQEARVHFHVPIFLENYGNIGSTQAQIVESIAYQKKYAITQQMEIETYTWGVLPNEFQKPMEESVAREVHWVLNQLD